MDKLIVVVLLLLFQFAQAQTETQNQFLTLTQTQSLAQSPLAESSEQLSVEDGAELIPRILLDKVDAGDGETAFFIATQFAQGSQSIEKDPELAKQWFLKSASLDNVHGMYEMGKLLYEDKVYDEAKQWFEKAAQKGHGESYYRLSLYSIYQLDDTEFNCELAYEQLLEAQKRDVKPAFNDHAWMLSTLPDKACRNGQKAWKIFADLQGLYAPSEPIPWAYLDTKAAVLAEISDFNEAIEVQSWIVEDFCDVDFTSTEQDFDAYVDQLTEEFSAGDTACQGALSRLHSYVKRQPWREDPNIY